MGKMHWIFISGTLVTPLLLRSIAKLFLSCHSPISSPRDELRMAPAEVTTAQVWNWASWSRGRGGTSRAQPRVENGCSVPSSVRRWARAFSSHRTWRPLCRGLRCPLWRLSFRILSHSIVHISVMATFFCLCKMKCLGYNS